MGKILCFVSDDLADFEITHALHKLKTVGKREVVAIGYDFNPVVSESGLTYLPDQTVAQALDLADVEGLLIPGGAIRPQKPEFTQLIQKLDREKRLLAMDPNTWAAPVSSTGTGTRLPTGWTKPRRWAMPTRFR